MNLEKITFYSKYITYRFMLKFRRFKPTSI